MQWASANLTCPVSLLEVVKAHFSTTLAGQNQPHTIALHVEFLRRTQAGPAIFTIQDVKLGRQTTTVHVSLQQEGREEIVAYVTNSNMTEGDGFSYDTEYKPSPPILSVDLSKLEQGTDPTWKLATNMPHAKFRKAMNQIHFHFPQNGRAAVNISDQWVCFSDGSNFTDSSIGFIADMFPQIAEGFREDNANPLWYPTLLMNIDMKKALPPGGVKWLLTRVEIKKVFKGRMDLEVWVYDAEGDLVALSHHVGLIVDASRNTAARRVGDAKI